MITKLAYSLKEREEREREGERERERERDCLRSSKDLSENLLLLLFLYTE